MNKSETFFRSLSLSEASSGGAHCMAAGRAGVSTREEWNKKKLEWKKEAENKNENKIYRLVERREEQKRRRENNFFLCSSLVSLALSQMDKCARGSHERWKGELLVVVEGEKKDLLLPIEIELNYDHMYVWAEPNKCFFSLPSNVNFQKHKI